MTKPNISTANIDININNTDISVLHEDEHLLIVNKPADLLTVPGRGPDKQDCLINRIIHHPNNQHWKNARIIHRLDMATSGIVVIALNKPAQTSMSILFAERKVSKAYTAVVDGQLTTEQTIKLPLICDWDNRPKQKVDYEHGKYAKTTVIPIDYDKTNNSSRVILVPLTGRSHQLRVHMLAIGHPMLGDYFYSPDAINNKSHRLLLHAHQITFSHPITQQIVNIESPTPF